MSTSAWLHASGPTDANHNPFHVGQGTLNSCLICMLLRISMHACTHASAQHAHLRLVDDAPVGVHRTQLAAHVHALRVGGRVEAEALAAAEEDVDVVVVVVVQTRAGACGGRVGWVVVVVVTGGGRGWW